MVLPQNFTKTMRGNHLSVLKNAGDNSITYYVGEDINHVIHLKNCTLICKKGFNPKLNNVEIINYDNPQLEFYKLSQKFKKDFLPSNDLIFNDKYKSYLHKNIKIGNNVKIGVNCVIGEIEISDNVEIHSNVTIHSNTFIGSNSIIESGTVIGSSGVMWVWENDKRVYLEQLGGVIIQSNCRIGSLIEIVRGSCNEYTLIGEGTCIAHGTLIGHGCQIGKYTHFANGVKLGGGVVVNNYCFLGSGSIISAGTKILNEDVIIGAGTVVVKNILDSGVYVGTPSKRIKKSTGKMSGIPTWRK